MQFNVINILATTFSLIGAITMMLSGAAKSREETFKLQVTDCIAHAIANVLLGGWSGAIATTISLIRAIISIKGKMNRATQAVLCSLMIVFGASFSHIGLIGLLPIISNVGYTIIGCSKSADFKKLKVSLAVSMLLWSVYDFAIGAYPTVAADLITAGMCVYAIAHHKSNKTEQKKTIVYREEAMCT